MDSTTIISIVLAGYLVVLSIALIFLLHRARWLNKQRQKNERMLQSRPIPCSYELLCTQLPVEHHHSNMTNSGRYFYGVEEQTSSSPDLDVPTKKYFSTPNIPIIVSSPETTYTGRRNSFQKENYPKIVLDDLWKPISTINQVKRNKLSLELQLNSHSPLINPDINGRFNGLENNELRAFDGSDEAYSSIFEDSPDVEPVSPLTPRSPQRKKIKKERTSLKNKLKSKLSRHTGSDDD